VETHNLGTVGLGHWVKRLHKVLKQHQEIKLVKTVGTRTFDDKKEELEEYGISEDRYYRIGAGDPLPDSFFQDLDIVHIASPNQFHKSQTIQSLENGKVTVTEKTFATNRQDFNEVLKFIRDNKFENRVAVHLHYLSKALTEELRKRLPRLIENYGRITGISATFFEKFNEEDARRTWLFKPENGGIFLDWIHPVEVASHVLKPDKMKLVNAKTFLIQPLYDMVNPSAVEAEFKLSGENFKEDSALVVRIGKGFELDHKKFRIKFEDATVDLNYLNTEEELASGKRGDIEIFNNGHHKITPQGPLSYEIMVKEMMRMLRGGSPSLTLEDTEKFYVPVWDFQEFAKGLQLIKDRGGIRKFVEDGLSNEN